MYGPVDGSGLFEVSFAGALAGRGAANSVARMFSKSPCDASNLMVILPLASSAVIPPIEPFFVLENAVAPTMFPKKPTPGESTLNRRSIVALKSLALTAVPSEYLRPLRRVSVYVLPSDETVGNACARYGTRVAPSGPYTCLYPISGR